MPGANHNKDAPGGLLVTLDDKLEELTVIMPVQRHLEIYNESGRLVMYAGVSGLVQRLSIRQLSNGRYLMKAGIYTGWFTVCRNIHAIE